MKHCYRFLFSFLKRLISSHLESIPFWWGSLTREENCFPLKLCGNFADKHNDVSVHFKLYGYTAIFFRQFYQGNDFRDLLLTFLNDLALPKWCLL